MESVGRQNVLSPAIIFMIQGLQTFHGLLVNILSTAYQTCEENTTQAGMHGYHKNQPTLNQDSWQDSKFWAPNLLGLTDDTNTDSLESISEPQNKRQRVLRSDTHVKSNTQDVPSKITGLDMSTCLLIISCYINLIRLCREVFAAVRDALPAHGHQSSFPTLSGFQIGGVSIHQDSDLQIIILTQVVLRLVEKIGLLLGHPFDSAAETGKKDQLELRSKAILPQLLDFLLRQEKSGGQMSCENGIEALKQEIRRLNEIVFKPV
ncbi:uncharacterized protein LY89DRAFT_730484 [Mollisia scopiformis]|uniref:Uncharacterized protein n=1 Tax=Mollisia scopiformis TaxID=149040 RepID=A0A194XKZ2_MOLSC|nr:uncharacterized protein LY89DRAFT_730484 [Mollisia scopiformis]KUJ20442.1 hypothetical protein LY89DRAFT_730484 [Mollisia scopiformis]